MESKQVVDVLGALAQETRLDVFRLLVQAGSGGLPAGEIAARLGVPAPTLSFHLRALAHAGLVSAQRSGRSLFYTANFEALREVVAFLTENCCAGAEAGAGRERGRPRGRRATG